MLCRGALPLCGWTRDGWRGNFDVVSASVAAKAIGSQSGHCAYVYDEHYTFHVYVADGVVVVALTEGNFDRKVAASVNRDVVRAAKQTYPNLLTTMPAVPHCLDTDFGSTVERIVASYHGHNARTIGLQSDIDEITALMSTNIEAIMARGDELAVLVDKSDGLSEKSIRFKKASRLLQYKLAWKDAQMIGLAAAAGGLFIYAITALTCGGLTLPTC